MDAGIPPHTPPCTCSLTALSCALLFIVQIMDAGTNKCLTAVERFVVLSTCRTGDTRQQFKLTEWDDGWCIHPQQGGCVDLPTPDSGTQLEHKQCFQNANQKFKIVPMSRPAGKVLWQAGGFCACLGPNVLAKRQPRQCQHAVGIQQQSALTLVCFMGSAMQKGAVRDLGSPAPDCCQQRS